MSTEDYLTPTPEQRGLLGRLVRYLLRDRLVAVLLVVAIILGGVVTAPFTFDRGPLPDAPVPTDAIPDIGANQQIIFTAWPGRSPQDVDDQITYPLTVALQGIPGVETVRSNSMFGFSTIYLIFEESMDFYESRSRIIEKLSSLQEGRDFPEGARPQLGPDATALGQIFWYTLEGRDPDGNPAGGWDLEELRTVQDWTVRLGLLGAGGVSDVGSVGGYVREYQVDVDPDAMRAYQVTLGQVVQAVRDANLDVGARTIEVNGVEYVIRGIGLVESVEDIGASVVAVRDDVPILVRHVATVSQGPATRRGALDRDGAEAVGGVVVARFGENPLAVIDNVKRRIDSLASSLPEKVVVDTDAVGRDTVEQFGRDHGFEAYADDGGLNQPAWLLHLRGTPRDRWPGWATISKVTVVPFYDRTGLIHETLGTLSSALQEQMLVTLIVVILMVVHLRSSVLIGSMLPLAVGLCFVAMKLLGVDANIVALSGIAIAIGTIVDMGIVVSENVLRHLRDAPPEAPRLEVVHRGVCEVGGAVFTAVATTVVSFLPVLAMVGAEGKLFRPLALTKTFALIASILIALTILPPAALVTFCWRWPSVTVRRVVALALAAALLVAGVYAAATGMALLALAAGAALAVLALQWLAARLSGRGASVAQWAGNLVIVLAIGWVLARHWLPLGADRGAVINFVFVVLMIGALLGFFGLFRLVYALLLRWLLVHKWVIAAVTAGVLVLGGMSWLGFERVFRFVPAAVGRIGGDPAGVEDHVYWRRLGERFPGLGRELMPPLDEGSFLYMPTTMTHASIGEALEILAAQDRAFAAIPEIDSAVGKIGRAETPLDPAPVSMIETIISYKSEYRLDDHGRRVLYRLAEGDEPAREDTLGRRFAVDEAGRLIEDVTGRAFRQWRPEIRTPQDIWDAIVAAGDIPSVTGASYLQPIEGRRIMLQTGMRAAMGIKIYGPDLQTIDGFALELEELVAQVPGVNPASVTADRIVGKPYLEIVPRRDSLVRVGDFNQVIETAMGGRAVTRTIEGRERFAVRVRYQREQRESIEALERLLVPDINGVPTPLSELAEIRYVPGPQMIKSEQTFLVGYVLFNKAEGEAEVELVERVAAYLQEKIDSGELIQPAGVSFEFAGNYQNQQRAERRLMWILPAALLLIFLILYFQLRQLTTTVLVFFGIAIAWAGGFMLLWLYGQGWFLDVSVFGESMREMFQIDTVNLSVAVWVGFLALFGIATDNGVIQATYLKQVFRDRKPTTVEQIRAATVEAARRRIRPCLMTSATTILALLPVLTSTGRGSDIMVPMAIPSFGGMLMVLLSVFFVPVAYSFVQELRLRLR